MPDCQIQNTCAALSGHVCSQQVLVGFIILWHICLYDSIQETKGEICRDWGSSLLFSVAQCWWIRIFREILTREFTCQQLFSKIYFQGKTLSCRQTHTDTCRHTLLIAQAELCAVLSILFVYFAATMYKHFQQNSLHLSLFAGWFSLLSCTDFWENCI